MEPATPPAPAAGVTATIDLSLVAADLGGAHLLPCGIRQNGGAPVSDYFKPRATGPDGYRGFVLEKRHGHNSNAEVNNFTSQAEFQSITYWNHDTTSSTEDSLPRCFHWLTVANASIAGVLMVDVLLNYKGLLGVLLVFVLHHLVMKENGTHSDLFIRKEIGCSTRD
ncbi:uncharacterized protein [Zea mays]|uniref:uncharacterized protein isoform X1 n=1 Tax=Zea mays TaxID=4577 RepID=UPI0004DEBFBE|nr:uncharacterized protein LOC103626668 isoform X1 [Zea mays]|eukprot:XP_023155947.1 uncharacterized protein LOC103626668 isoform X2 [Zea mays]